MTVIHSMMTIQFFPFLILKNIKKNWQVGNSGAKHVTRVPTNFILKLQIAEGDKLP